MKDLFQADREALHAMIPSRDPKPKERCSECGWPFQPTDKAYHVSGGEEFGYCSPNCLEIAEGLES